MGDMNQSDKTRLDRIEEKIDRMSEAVIALARAEEKIISLDETTRMILRKMGFGILVTQSKCCIQVVMLYRHIVVKL